MGMQHNMWEWNFSGQYELDGGQRSDIVNQKEANVAWVKGMKLCACGQPFQSIKLRKTPPQ